MGTVREVSDALLRAHRESPNERAAQLMFNALDARHRARMADGTPRDIFYVTNEELAAALHDYADWIVAGRLTKKTSADREVG